MLDQQLDEREVDRGNWIVDEWDEVGEVPTVEPIRQQNRIVKWAVWCLLVLVTVLVLVAGYIGWWYLGRVAPDGELSEPIPFTVEETDTMVSLSLRLEREGVG